MKQQTVRNSNLIPLVATPSIDTSLDIATLELLESWRIQDATSSPVEMQLAELELVKLKQAMNENRRLAGEPLIFP